MERYTYWCDDGKGGGEWRVNTICGKEQRGPHIDRLASIEDILGEDYDIDSLRELVEADRDGRCVVMPCSGWMETVFGDQETFYGIDHDYLENPVREISVDSSDRCTWYDGWKTVVIKGYDENGCDWEFSPEEIGKTVFRTREAAEAALKGEAYGG